MTAKEIREKSNTEDFSRDSKRLKMNFFNLRFQQATGQLTNTARLKAVKKDIARMKTVLTERELSNQD